MKFLLHGCGKLSNVRLAGYRCLIKSVVGTCEVCRFVSVIYTGTLITSAMLDGIFILFGLYDPSSHAFGSVKQVCRILVFN